MNNNFIIQYTIVGVIVVLACIWIMIKILKKNDSRNNNCHSGCCGCGLADKCAKPRNPNKQSS